MCWESYGLAFVRVSAKQRPRESLEDLPTRRRAHARVSRFETPTQGVAGAEKAAVFLACVGGLINTHKREGPVPPLTRGLLDLVLPTLSGNYNVPLMNEQLSPRRWRGTKLPTMLQCRLLTSGQETDPEITPKWWMTPPTSLTISTLTVHDPHVIVPVRACKSERASERESEREREREREPACWLGHRSCGTLRAHVAICSQEEELVVIAGNAK